MAFKWLKRRRNTVAADSTPTSAQHPRGHPATNGSANGRANYTSGAQTVAYRPSSTGAGTPTSEEPKIRRRKSSFQSLRSKKDTDKERKRASSFGATSPPHLDTSGAPPVPPLPSGTAPIAAQFASPPTRLDPAPRGKRLSLIPRKAPPSAWAGANASAADDSGVPTGAAPAAAPVPTPAAVAPSQTPTAPTTKPAKAPLGAIQLDDLDSSLALAPELSALDALDRLDAIGGADLDLAPSLKAPGGRPGAPAGLGPSVNAGPPSAFASSSSSKRASLPVFDKPLPAAGSSLAPKPGASKHFSLAPRKNGGMPDIDGVAAIKPSAGKMMQGELPPPPGAESSVRPTAELSAPSADSAVRSAPEPEAGSKKKAGDTKDAKDGNQASASTGADATEGAGSKTDASTGASSQAGYRQPLPAGVETAPLPDILNRPSAGYDPSGVSKTGSKAPEGPAESDDAPRVMGGPRKIQAVDAAASEERGGGDAQIDRPPIVGGPGKIQAVMDSSQEGRADDPTPATNDAPERPPIMGGPGKIQAVWEISRDAQEGDGTPKAESGADTKDDSAGQSGDKNAEETSEDKKAEDAKAASGETEEMVDDAASDTASEVQPISTDFNTRPLSTSTWASTERLVDDDARHSSFSDRDRTSMLTDFGSPRRLSTDTTSHGLLGTPSRSRLPSTQTFGNLPGTTTFGALPRPASVVSPAVGAVEEGDEGEEEGELAAVAEGETAQADARAKVDAPGIEEAPEDASERVAPSGGDGPEDSSAPTIATTAPTTPPRISTAESVPELCTPGDGTPPSQHITTPAPSAHPSLASTPAHPSTSPFKATRSVSTPSKAPLLRSLSPHSPERAKLAHIPGKEEAVRIPSPTSLRPVGRRSVSTPVKEVEKEGGEEPTLDDFMTLFRQVQGRGKGVSIRAAAAAAEGKDPRGRERVVGVAQ